MRLLSHFVIHFAEAYHFLTAKGMGAFDVILSCFIFKCCPYRLQLLLSGYVCSILFFGRHFKHLYRLDEWLRDPLLVVKQDLTVVDASLSMLMIEFSAHRAHLHQWLLILRIAIGRFPFHLQILSLLRCIEQPLKVALSLNPVVKLAKLSQAHQGKDEPR